MLSKGGLKKTAKLLIYIGLLVIGIVFSLDGIHEYAKGKTTFRIETKPLVKSDLPATTICFEFVRKNVIVIKPLSLDYGKDVQIKGCVGQANCHNLSAILPQSAIPKWTGT